MKLLDSAWVTETIVVPAPRMDAESPTNEIIFGVKANRLSVPELFDVTGIVKSGSSNVFVISETFIVGSALSTLIVNVVVEELYLESWFCVTKTTVEPAPII